jgi:hypothetical protein
MLSPRPAGADGGLVVDLNCDMGEGMDTDAAIFPFISVLRILPAAAMREMPTL